METILSDMNNNLDLTKLNKTKLEKLIKVFRKDIRETEKMLDLPLTSDEADFFCGELNTYNKDIRKIENYLKEIN